MRSIGRSAASVQKQHDRSALIAPEYAKVINFSAEFRPCFLVYLIFVPFHPVCNYKAANYRLQQIKIFSAPLSVPTNGGGKIFLKPLRKLLIFPLKSSKIYKQPYGDMAQLVRALCSHRRGRGFESLYLHQRFELRLEAIQKRAARLPLIFCSAPCPALRSVPLSGIEIVTLRFSPLFRRFAPYESLYLYQSKPKINHYQIKCFRFSV